MRNANFVNKYVGFGPLNIYGTVSHKDFIFGRHIQHNKYLPTDDKFPPNMVVVRVT